MSELLKFLLEVDCGLFLKGKSKIRQIKKFTIINIVLAHVKAIARTDLAPSLILSHGLILFRCVEDTFFHTEKLKATIKVSAFLL